jgi:hypothetical protein
LFAPPKPAKHRHGVPNTVDGARPPASLRIDECAKALVHNERHRPSRISILSILFILSNCVLKAALAWDE